MSIGSFSAGLSGINANSAYLSVIGNNLANLNTVAYKSSTVSFTDLVSQTLSAASTNPMQVGLGVSLGSISPVFSQGNIENTGEGTNIAIQGSGFFVLKGADGTSYTRAGNFAFDKDGALITPEGLRLQGYTQTDPITGDILTTGATSDLIIPLGLMRSPTATTEFKTLTNLDGGSAVGTTFSTAVEIYDSLGSSHVVTVNYTMTGPGAWSYALTAPGDEVTGGTAGTPFSLGTGTLTFGADGKLSALNGAAPADVAITTPTWTNGAAASTLNWDVVDTDGTALLTGYSDKSGKSATSTITQNGGPAGMIASVNIRADGVIEATLGAGQRAELGRVALANFNNPKGLIKLGSNRYSESQSAGVANVGAPGAGGRGTLIGSALEQSNVDMAREFTQMILAQRGYQASSKSITVADELLVETLNLKR